MIGKVISHYRIVEKLGEGGMGVVYKAQDQKLERFVALKFLPPHFLGDEEQRQRFIQEAKAASSLDHPNVCTIHEIGKTDEGQLYICMAFYDGVTLRTMLRAGPLSVDKVLHYAVQIARGLSRAHEADITHRDIKPANIVVTNRDEVKILDFGVAKLARGTGLTKTGTTLGTVSYMSPEQARGDKVDHRTDIWSLGVIIYQMLTGELPFKGELEQAVIYSILNENPAPLSKLRSDTPKALVKIVSRAMKKDPSKRFQLMDDMRFALESLKYELTSDTPGSGVRAVAAARKGTRRAVLWVALAGVTLATASYFLLSSRPSTKTRQVAMGARRSMQAAEREALLKDAPRFSRVEISEANRLKTEAQTELEAGAHERAAVLFDRATVKFEEAADSAKMRGRITDPLEHESSTIGAPQITEEVTEEVESAAKPEERSPEAKKDLPPPDLLSRVERQRQQMIRAKREAERIFAAELAKNAYVAASTKESEAETLVARGELKSAEERFEEARELYQRSTEEARLITKESKEEGEDLRSRIRQVRASMSPDHEFIDEYRDGVQAEREGDVQWENTRTVAAVRSYKVALDKFEAAGAKRDQQVADINAVIHRYGRALESEDIRALESLHTEFTAAMRDDWVKFFETVTDLRVKITVVNIRFNERGALASTTVQLSYSGARGSEKAHVWEMHMRRQEGRWLISDVKRNS